jgi:hypothetical protein
MSIISFFVGPYVEFRSEHDVWPSQPDLRDAWDALLNDGRRMEWNLPWSNSQVLNVDGVQIYQYCGMPKESRPGVPRWPMLFRFEEPVRETDSLDWSELNPKAEIAWFKEAFAEEVVLLQRIFAGPPEFRWGFIYWPR